MTTGDDLPRAVGAAAGPCSGRRIHHAFAFGALGALAALFGCGARSSLSDFASAAGPSAGSESSAGSNGTSGTSGSSGACVDTQNDAANCGACGALCTGVCTNGRCLVTLASEQNNVDCIALDAKNVFWARAGLPGNGAINRVSVDGGPVVTIATTPSAPWPCRMAVDAMFVYWADGSNGSVLKARIRGSVAATLAPAPGANANYIAVDGANVYWTGQFGYPTKVSLSGGATTRLTNSYGGNGIAIDATGLYWTARGAGDMDGTIEKIPLTGGPPTILASGQGLPEGIAVDDANVYWADYVTGTIQKMSHDGGAITTLASEQVNPTSIAVDEASVYWSSSIASLAKAPKAGGQTTVLADSHAFDIAVDARSVYWTDGSAVLKLTPK